MKAILKGGLTSKGRMVSVVSAGLYLSLISVISQDFSVEEISVGGDGTVAISVATEPNHYYALFSGTEVTDLSTAEMIRTGTD